MKERVQVFALSFWNKEYIMYSANLWFQSTWEKTYEVGQICLQVCPPSLHITSTSSLCDLLHHCIIGPDFCFLNASWPSWLQIKWSLSLLSHPATSAFQALCINWFNVHLFKEVGLEKKVTVTHYSDVKGKHDS